MAKEQVELKQESEDAEDRPIDMAWYRLWSTNPDLDLSFLEEELEPTLAKWKVRLEEEELLTFSEAAARDVSKGNQDGEVSSKATSKNGASLVAEIDALMEEDTDVQAQVDVEQAEAASTAKNAPPQTQVTLSLSSIFFVLFVTLSMPLRQRRFLYLVCNSLRILRHQWSRQSFY